MRRSKSVTLSDVALAAGVAKMTVSVVLNGSRSDTRVADTTRTRIVEAASRLGYRPNGIARGLSRQRIDGIGVVTPHFTGLNLYFLDLFSGILDAAAELGQATTVYRIKDWAGPEIQQQLLRLCDGRVDGLILLGPYMLSERVTEAIQRHTPLVSVHGSRNPVSLPNVDVDNEKGLYLATRYLIELGHRRIAYFAGNKDDKDGMVVEAGAAERERGYESALKEAGIDLDPQLVVPGTYRADSGRERALNLLNSECSLPTAIACASDAVALGTVEVLKSHGTRIPEDISVIGFDDGLTTHLISPPLTTVRQPFDLLGQAAVRILLAEVDGQIEDPDESSMHTRHADLRAERANILDVSLIIRESTAPPRRI